MTKSELGTLQMYLSGMPVKGLELDRILKVIDLIKNVREKAKSYVMSREKIFHSYDIPVGRVSETEADHKYHTHPQYSEIRKLIIELGDSPEELTPTNFLSQDELIKIIKNYDGLQAGGIILLQEVLLKNE